MSMQGANVSHAKHCFFNALIKNVFFCADTATRWVWGLFAPAQHAERGS